ncbi:subtilisin-like protease SBT1.7 [Arachis stenosperma]|uniref:subtilisin-like protease SBT1.7 n=1 Tax=Arachis stenosperma TaxID=217475 RepID=UPI0025AC09B5|nr:subtilisin-like protease SBT1.7 [Arachis stenosperma]
MKMQKFKFLHTLLLLIFYAKHTIAENNIKQSKKTYIVHMEKSTMPASFNDHHNWFESSLQSVSESAEMLYTYKHVVHGFSTRLTNQEAEALSKQPGILSLIPERKYELHTTRTPYFLGLDLTLASLDRFSTHLPASVAESEVIIGVLDSGIWPEHESLDDTGFGPIPSRWKGECESGKNFNSSHCNRKLIGARFFHKGHEQVSGPINEEKESKSPRDEEGHGTHTLTTAAGSIVSGASLFGLAPGTARGMSTQARVASYKVCWKRGCYSSDIAAAIDKAIEDGVDILSMSLGSKLDEYYQDLIAIGAFRATSHGILVSISAGNSGPFPGNISNVAPWMTTVGAGTIDRDFPAYVSLGNGMTYAGSSLYVEASSKLLDTPLPLVYAGNVSNSTLENRCETNTLIPSRVSGKIVLCKRGGSGRFKKGLEVKRAGGIGMLVGNGEEHGEELVADAHLVPAALLGKKASDAIRDYILSCSNATATLSFGGTQLQVQPSPVVAAFSSRGPNPLSPKILKPDLIGPGVNILAGWTGAAGPTGLEEDSRRTTFNILSGTSMSCPHISGLAAILKAAHPQWSPAAIRSALMTTSYTTYTNGYPIMDIATQQPATPFDFGAGHVDPLLALDPGLIYDADIHDYLNFLCASNYNSSQIKVLARTDFTCVPSMTYRVEDLNYPSFAVPFETPNNSVQYSRTLTNVGALGTYKASVSFQSDTLVEIVVEPETLTFTELFEKKNYTVTFTSSNSVALGTNSFAYLKWSDGQHKVVSPIAFSWI